MNSITRRWVRGSLLLTFIALCLAEAVFLYFTITNYYDGTARALYTRANTLSTQLSAMGTQTDESRGAAVRRMVEQFGEKDRFELMLMDGQGQMAVSSTGFSTADQQGWSDVAEAYASEEGMGRAVYHTAMGEKVMAVTVRLPFTSGDIVAMRLVTSLTLVDRSILKLAVLSLSVAAAILVFSVWSGMFFVRSIVRPIGEIEQTAAKMAQGNLDMRISNKYDDEIGKLAGTINHMAGELDKTERIKNEFISSVSHELRTPLTSIKGWVETMSTIRDPADPNYQRGLQVIANETDRLYDMVEELLDFSRMQNGLSLECEKLDLAAEVSDAVLTMTPRARQEGLALRWEEPEAPVPVHADAARLRQVFINVLDNAVKYSPPGGTITVELLQDGHNAFLNFTDEGRGIYNMAENLVVGYRCLMRSADISMTEEEKAEDESKFDRWVQQHLGEKGESVLMGIASFAGVALAIALFLVLPTLLVGGLSKLVPLGGAQTLREGVLQIAILVGYMAAVSRVKEIHRMFCYHGAEHKTIACYEAGLPLEVENVRKCCRFHPRCGTSFLLIVIVVSILLNSVIPWGSLSLRVVFKLLLLPVVVAVSYEIIKLCGKYDNAVCRAVSAPGLWLQRITTQEPDDSMIECAIAAVTPVLPARPDESVW